MSVINKVLEDLDKREAMAAANGRLPPQQVRPVHGPAAGREWFWRTVAFLIVAALAWVGWVAWQLRPRPPVATDAALRAGESAKKPREIAAAKPARAPVAPRPAAPPPVPAAQAPALPQPPAAAQPQEQRRVAPPQIDSLKLALAIETPITTKPAPAAKPAGAARPAPRSKSTPASNASASPRLEKRDSTRVPASRGEGDYRRAVAFLNQGRLSDAENRFAAALDADPGHEAARQAWAALLVEQGQFEAAKTLLAGGLERDPANSEFAVVLARILAGQGDYPSALGVLEKVPAAARGAPEYHSLRGALLQKLKRHAEASEAYRAVLKAQPENGTAWLGLGISLEALARRAEAADAFKRAVATGTLAGDVRRYAEQRAQALQ